LRVLNVYVLGCTQNKILVIIELENLSKMAVME